MYFGNSNCDSKLRDLKYYSYFWTPRLPFNALNIPSCSHCFNKLLVLPNSTENSAYYILTIRRATLLAFLKSFIVQIISAGLFSYFFRWLLFTSFTFFPFLFFFRPVPFKIVYTPLFCHLFLHSWALTIQLVSAIRFQRRCIVAMEKRKKLLFSGRWQWKRRRMPLYVEWQRNRTRKRVFISHILNAIHSWSYFSLGFVLLRQPVFFFVNTICRHTHLFSFSFNLHDRYHLTEAVCVCFLLLSCLDLALNDGWKDCFAYKWLRSRWIRFFFYRHRFRPYIVGKQSHYLYMSGTISPTYWNDKTLVIITIGSLRPTRRGQQAKGFLNDTNNK